MSAEAEAGDDEPARAIIAIPPPPTALRDSVARLLVEILARQALADLGLGVHNDNRQPPG